MTQLTPELITEAIGPVTKQVKALQTIAESLRQAQTPEDRQAALKQAREAANKLAGAADDVRGPHQGRRRLAAGQTTWV